MVASPGCGQGTVKNKHTSVLPEACGVVLVPSLALCQSWGYEVLEEADPHPQLPPSSEDRGFLVLCPQPQNGSPQADTLPRPRSGQVAPTLPLPLLLPGWGTWGPSVSVVCVCVAPGPEGCCTGMLCPPGSVHIVKSNCLKAVVLGFVFFPPFLLHPTIPSWKGGAGCSRPQFRCWQHSDPSLLLLFDSFFFHSSLSLEGDRAVWPGTQRRDRVGDGPTPCWSRSHVQPRGWGLVESGCFGEPHVPPVEERPYLQPWPAQHSLAPSTASGFRGAEEVPGVLGCAAGFAGSWRGSGGCSPPSQLGPS